VTSYKTAAASATDRPVHRVTFVISDAASCGEPSQVLDITGIPCNMLLSLFESVGQWRHTRNQLPVNNQLQQLQQADHRFPKNRV